MTILSVSGLLVGFVTAVAALAGVYYAGRSSSQAVRARRQAEVDREVQAAVKAAVDPLLREIAGLTRDLAEMENDRNDWRSHGRELEAELRRKGSR